MALRKAEMVETVRKLVRESLELRIAGATGARAARAQGYADGYMRLMLDNEVVSGRELLAIVRAEREQFEGPATAALASEAVA